MNNELKCHPAAELFPMMDGEQFESLVADIKANGLLEPIGLYEEMVIDGRNRLRACNEAGVSPEFEEISCSSPTIYVISKNLHRRHLSFEQRVSIGVNMLPLLEQEASERQRNGGCASPEEKGYSSDVAAAAVQVSGASIERAKAIKEADPEMFEQLKAGKVKIRPAYDKIQRAKKPTVPYEVDTKRKEQLANGQKQRIVEGVSMMFGICSEMQKVDVNKASSVMDRSEIDGWINKISDCRRLLTRLMTALERESQNGR